MLLQSWGERRFAKYVPDSSCCCHWAQVFILDSLAAYDTRDPRDAEKIAERVLPRLQHVNSAVVLSAVKVRRTCPQRRPAADRPPRHPLLAVEGIL